MNLILRTTFSVCFKSETQFYLPIALMFIFIRKQDWVLTKCELLITKKFRVSFSLKEIPDL